MKESRDEHFKEYQEESLIESLENQMESLQESPKKL